MPQRTRNRICKPQHEKSRKELGCQERKRADGLFGKAHQLFVLCNAKVALVVQYPRTGRTISYYSDENWPSGRDLEALLDPSVECLGTSDFTESGKRKSRRTSRRTSRGTSPINQRLRGAKHDSREELPKDRNSPPRSLKGTKSVSPLSNISPGAASSDGGPLKGSWLDVVLRK